MAVIIGSARIDENGKAHGGAAGDQTGKEVSTQAWYDRDWRVLRPKDPAKAKKIAKGMQSACDNANIGYDQYQRHTLYNLVKPLGYDPAKANKKCETDCSALVRVCCCYGGIMVGDFNTESEARVLMATGEFVELTGSKYTSQSDYLGIGDILVTRKKGHTVVVLSNGPKYDGALASEPRKLGERILREGDEGEDVEEMQQRLDWIGFHPGEIDGIFGTKTKMAVKDLQTRAGIEVDGEFGPDSYAALVAFEACSRRTHRQDVYLFPAATLLLQGSEGAGDRLRRIDDRPCGRAVRAYRHRTQRLALHRRGRRHGMGEQ